MSVPLEDIPVLEISRNLNKTYDKELNVETDGAIECQNMAGHRRASGQDGGREEG
jgi:hypothetical protein